MNQNWQIALHGRLSDAPQLVAVNSDCYSIITAIVSRPFSSKPVTVIINEVTPLYGTEQQWS